MEEKVVCVLELKPGEKGEVYGLFPPGEMEEKGWGWGHRHRHGRRWQGPPGPFKRSIERLLEAVGLYQGQIIEVVENRGWGPVILKVENGGKFILGRGQASCIFVKKINK